MLTVFTINSSCLGAAEPPSLFFRQLGIPQDAGAKSPHTNAAITDRLQAVEATVNALSPPGQPKLAVTTLASALHAANEDAATARKEAAEALRASEDQGRHFAAEITQVWQRVAQLEGSVAELTTKLTLAGGGDVQSEDEGPAKKRSRPSAGPSGSRGNQGQGTYDGFGNGGGGSRGGHGGGGSKGFRNKSRDFRPDRDHRGDRDYRDNRK
ncbi:hypothetical protein MKEN_01457900 [Mycena kentingensis (nom. inval.)]|nr:hypothetical protein MKEN_01457900 [Mycena kentingensis (nom. inval.)]